MCRNPCCFHHKHSSFDCFELIPNLFPSTERQVFLATWKDIPNDNESQFQIKDCHLNSGLERVIITHCCVHNYS